MLGGMMGMMHVVPYKAAAGPLTRMHLVVRIPDDGDARASGTVHFGDGASTTVLVAEQAPTTASCADVDGDGVGGLTRLTVTLRDVRTGEPFLATVLPDGGEADEAGLYPATLVLTGPRTITATGTLRIKGRFG